LCYQGKKRAFKLQGRCYDGKTKFEKNSREILESELREESLIQFIKCAGFFVCASKYTSFTRAAT